MQLVVNEEHAEQLKFRSLAQLLVNPDKGVEAFSEYLSNAYPRRQGAKTESSSKVKEILAREAALGPLNVTPLRSPGVRTGLEQRRAEERARMYSRVRRDLV